MLSPGRDVLGLERISGLLKRLGDPQHRIPPVFHVAGTNGKGSTCALLRAVLEAEGHAVHVYTSPHLVRFNERIRIAGRLIGDGLLAELLQEVLDCSTDIAPSFFEATTAVAFLAFSRCPADATIVEVGLGGRLDATNVIERPVVCGIAQLGMDHQIFLGDDPAAIAGEKAGIAKAGVPLVTMAYGPRESRKIASVANAACASLKIRNRDWSIENSTGGLVYSDQEGSLTLPKPRLQGQHQAENAGLAIAMIRHQQAISVTQGALRKGLATASWPGRLQRLEPGPLTSVGPDRAEIWLDGCHNPASAETLSAQVRELLGPPEEVAIICGILSNKDAQGILEPFLDAARRFVTLPVPDHPHHDPGALAVWINDQGRNAVCASDVREALTMLNDRQAPHAILILGSLYLVGDILKENGQYPD